MPTPKGKTKRSPLWLLINAVSVRDLQQLLFEKAAKDFKVDWNTIETKDMDIRADQILAAAEQLQSKHIKRYLDYYSSLKIISIAAASKNIVKYLHKVTNTKPVQTPFFADHFKMQRTPSERLTHPANSAAWLCVKEDFADIWNEIVGMANAAEQQNVSWQHYNIDPPTKIEAEERDAGIDEFKAEFQKDMEEEKKMDFPITVHPNLSTGKYVRYSISIPKDPSKAYLVDKDRVIIGLDPTMYTFFVDHYFTENMIRVSWPMMCEERYVADLFAKHVLGSQVKDEPVLRYTKPLRNFTSSKVSEKMMEVQDDEKDIIQSIFISSVDFTYAETESEAEKVRRMREDKKFRAAKKFDELRPAFKCYNYKGKDIWKYLDEHFNPTRYKAEWRDVLSITFLVKLYKVESCGEQRLRNHCATRDFKIICKPDRLRYSPAMHEIVEPEYKDALRYIATQKLKLIGEQLSETVTQAREDGADGSQI